MSEQRVPCVEGLFSETDGGAVIHGSRCTSCDTPYFPKTSHCHNPGCDESHIEDYDFGGKGLLWSYSVADFPPPPPHKYDEPFKPYVIGVVDLDAGLRMVGQMVDPLEAVQIGAQVELVIDTLYHEDGKAHTSWKFKQLQA
ncbi:MAG: OB-fold domain-containing protein [Halioglobus sp.]|nr:OB-fold domain-containing protein [Halioglobus sp.]